ncbi:MAG: hypothetical protein IKW96_12240 [Ruminococcus sp.]|uniref:hypothetical protein n=1 Tax=Ruminococcus sp. TaxID=41978 RepID=UPI0025CEBA1F|nr:hypothetical protein [Ruminococcus sp.]MBR5684024.1 hypothetical protein [Ruminococcus sp.]
MKADFKMTLTAIAATAMCAVPMFSMIANADTYEKGNRMVIENEEFQLKNEEFQFRGTTPSQEFRPVRTTIVLTKLPPNTWTEIYTKLPPRTWINPCTDPIRDKFEIDDRYYMANNIKTTTVEVAKNIR